MASGMGNSISTPAPSPADSSGAARSLSLKSRISIGDAANRVGRGPPRVAGSVPVPDRIADATAGCELDVARTHAEINARRVTRLMSAPLIGKLQRFARQAVPKAYRRPGGRTRVGWQEGRPAGSPSADGRPDVARVRIVEDNPANMKLATFLLQSAGHIVLSVTDAEAGVTLAHSEQPDLILMDIQLPGMDGLEATALLKQDDATRAIPVIALSALAMKGDEERIRAAGCDGYIAKPMGIQNFLATIAAQLVGTSIPPKTSPAGGVDDPEAAA